MSKYSSDRFTSASVSNKEKLYRTLYKNSVIETTGPGIFSDIFKVSNGNREFIAAKYFQYALSKQPLLRKAFPSQNPQILHAHKKQLNDVRNPNDASWIPRFII